jgi:hypothetical protein
MGILMLQELERRVSDVKAEIARNKARQQRIAGIMAGHHTEPSIPTEQLERQLAAIVQLKVFVTSEPSVWHACKHACKRE